MRAAMEVIANQAASSPALTSYLQRQCHWTVPDISDTGFTQLPISIHDTQESSS
jgi:hypothetical protein